MTLIYKILSRAEWAAAKAAGRFEGSAVDHQDGFIHLSAADQAQETAARYFKDQADLVLFPHLYRPLLISEVLSEAALSLDADGVPRLGDHLA